MQNHISISMTRVKLNRKFDPLNLDILVRTRVRDTKIEDRTYIRRV